MRRAGPPARRCFLALLALSGCLLAGCGELLRPPPPGPPIGLLDGATGTSPLADPTRTAIEAVAEAFDEGGRRMAGRPAAVAQAVAQLEFITDDLPDNPRFTAMSPTIWRELRRAREETRHALGINELAPPRQVQEALLNAARAMRAGHPASAAAALPPSLFDPAGTATLERLNDLGPVPQSSLATRWVLEGMAQLDADGSYGAFLPPTSLPSSLTVTGPAQGMGVGY